MDAGDEGWIATKGATSSIAIVFMTAIDPVAAKLIESLSM
jgi:hypothetical protein